MTKGLLMRVPAIVLALIVIVAVMASPGNPATPTSGGATYGADQFMGQVSASGETQSTGRQVYISDEDALQRIEQAFGPEVASSLKYRAIKTITADFGGEQYGDRDSAKWCGYEVIDPSANSVRADFNVCKTSTTHAWTATWVGLGNSSTGLIQTGYCMRQNPPYSYFKAWYELLPDAPVYIDDFSINVGDDLGATVQYSGGGSYFLCIFNETTGHYFASYFNYAPSPVRAEWIVETIPTWKIGNWNTGSYGSQCFWNAYWWNGPDPYAVHHGINDGAAWNKVKMNTASPYYEHMTAYYDDATSFHAQKTST